MSSVAPRRVGPLRTVGRGLTGRCGRCGGRGVHRGFFRLQDRCPRCGYRFVREEGAWTGVMLVNLSVTEGLLFLALFVFIILRAGSDEGAGPLLPILALCGLAAVALPIAFYPIASTTWAAIDLVLRPLEPAEEAEAATWSAAH